MHLIVDRDTGERWLYDLESDPAQAHPIDPDSAEAWEHERAFDTFTGELRKAARRTERAVDRSDDLDQLRKLGY